MAKAVIATLMLALLASTALASPLRAAAGRRLLFGGGGGGGGGWDGGIQTQDIMSENAAAAGIEAAVSGDSFGSTYAATSGGYRDAYGATFPDEANGQFWINTPGAGRR